MPSNPFKVKHGLKVLDGNIEVPALATIDGVDLSEFKSSYNNRKLAGNSDVTENSITNGEILVYNVDHWENKTLAEAGIQSTVSLTENRVVITDPANNLTVSAVTSTELSLLSGVTGTLAITSDITTHNNDTTNIHGIVNTADLALKSGNISQFADISSSGTLIEDAVSKRHVKNTDVGTTSQTFYLNTSGVKIKDSSGKLEVRNNADTAYADLIVNNLTVKGTTTVIETETVTVDDNIILLNANYTGSSPTEAGGIHIERGTLTNASLIWDEANDVWKAGLAGAEKTLMFDGDLPQAHNLESHSNITITTPANDDFLVYNSGNWINKSLSALQLLTTSSTNYIGEIQLKGLGGVALTGGQAGDVLQWASGGTFQWGTAADPNEVAYNYGYSTSFEHTNFGTAIVTVDSFLKTSYKSVMWLLYLIDNVNSRYETAVITAVHDSTNVYYNEYGNTYASLPAGISLEVVINANNVELKASGTSSINTIRGIRNTIVA